VTKLYQLYWEKDCAMVEVNPLLVDQGRQAARASTPRCRSTTTPSTATRTSPALRDDAEEDAKEIEASQVRPDLHRARRQHRLPGQRRGPRDGDDGHHQALRRRARPTSSTSAAARRRTR
jgi:hypothetical protein